MKLAQDLKVADKTYKKGTDCPESEVSRLLMHNREYLELEYKDSYPILTKEQIEKYGVPSYIYKVSDKEKVMKIEKRKYSQEKLLIKLNKLGEKEFKIWTEKEFGEDEIDRRKTPKAIIVEILRKQEADRR